MSEPRELKPAILFGDHEQSDPNIKDFRPKAVAVNNPELGEVTERPPDEAPESTGNEGASIPQESTTSPWDEDEPPAA